MIVKMLTGTIAALMMVAPAAAQTGAAHHDAMGNMAGHATDGAAGHKPKASAADTTKMASCNAMSHADAAKDAGCAALMKAHPELMDHKPAKPHGAM